MESDAEDIKGRVRMGGLTVPAQSEKDWRGKWNWAQKYNLLQRFLYTIPLQNF